MIDIDIKAPSATRTQHPVDVTATSTPTNVDGVVPGKPGDPGASAYDLAVVEGFQGTVEEWLESLQGSDGQPGAPTVVNGKTGESIELDAADVGAIPSTAGMWVVEHGDDAGVSRPDAPAVYWIGSVEPVNAVDNDLWIGGM